jgi:hypothetical protein
LIYRVVFFQPTTYLAGAKTYHPTKETFIFLIIVSLLSSFIRGYKRELVVFTVDKKLYTRTGVKEI